MSESVDVLILFELVGTDGNLSPICVSATTAALVSSQPFVGWKHSGSTGKGAGSENYLQQFMRSQTQTRCD